MDINTEPLLNYIHVWHHGYHSPENKQLVCPSLLWLQQMILVVLNDFLPYTEIDVIDDLSEKERKEEDDKLQAIPLATVFQLVKHITKDLLCRISISICEKLGYVDLPTEVAISRMKIRELDQFRSSCIIRFEKTKENESVSTSVTVSMENDDCLLLAKINRGVIAICNSTMPLVTVLCQYKAIEDGQLCFYDYNSGTDNVLDSCVSSIVEKIRELTVGNTVDGCRIPVYFSAVQKRNNALYSSISIGKSLAAEEESKGIAAVSDWNERCSVLCEEAVNIAFTIINNRE